MKVLLHSNAPWAPTGYGAQTALFAPLLAEHHDLAISAFYGLEGDKIIWNDIPVFPGLGGEFGNAYLTEHARRFFGDLRDGLVLTLLDVWVLRSQMAAGLNMASWVPVDHEPAPPAVSRFFSESGAVPLALSEFGAEQLEPFDPLYVPHGVDVDAYKPYPRDDVREKVGFDKNDFVVGIVAANKGVPSRKCFQQSFEAFRYLRERHENAKLYLHTTLDPSIASGEDLAALLGSLEIPEDSVKLADQYRMMFDPYPPRAMGMLYSCFDVLLNPSAGEGFGIPVLEANACGVPAIVTEFSAMKEVCGAGWQVQARPFWTPQKSWQAVPDVPDILDALEQCYALPPAGRKKIAEKARKHALHYAAPRVLNDFMLPALEEAAERHGMTEAEPEAAA